MLAMMKLCSTSHLSVASPSCHSVTGLNALPVLARSSFSVEPAEVAAKAASRWDAGLPLSSAVAVVEPLNVSPVRPSGRLACDFETLPWLISDVRCVDIAFAAWEESLPWTSMGSYELPDAARCDRFYDGSLWWDDFCGFWGFCGCGGFSRLFRVAACLALRDLPSSPTFKSGCLLAEPCLSALGCLPGLGTVGVDPRLDSGFDALPAEGDPSRRFTNEAADPARYG